MTLFLGFVLSYFIGSIPTAYLFARAFKGIDIREHGSGNVGATNVFRVLGKGPGWAVLILDIVKGIVPVALLADYLGCPEVLSRIVFAVGVVCGHNWTCFLKFKGGKGIATSLGVLIALTIKIGAIRPVLVFVVLIWLGCFLLTRIVSLSSIVASTALPVLMVITVQQFSLVCLGVIFAVFVVVRHRPNIKRLLAGQESRVLLSFKFWK